MACWKNGSSGGNVTQLLGNSVFESSVTRWLEIPTQSISMKTSRLAFSILPALIFVSCDQAPPGLTAAGGLASVVSIVSAAPKSDTPAMVKSSPATSGRETASTLKMALPEGPTVKIAPTMPMALFEGTPLPGDNTIPNLDKPGTPAVFSVEMPEGVQLLSQKAPVSSSCVSPFNGSLDFVTDGEKDGNDGYVVELDPGKQWVQIDLGSSKEIWGMWMWHSHKQAWVYKGVVVQASDDPSFNSSTTLYNNDFDNSVGLGVGKDNSYVETNNGRFVAGKGTKARYVRCWTNGRYLDEMNHYVEVEIYGK